MATSIPKPRASFTVAQGSSPVMKVPLGSRVVLSRRRNGTVRYVGRLTNEAGEWYGVALDEPKGDNDGTRAKERYFNCPPNHGIFVRRKEIHCVKEPSSIFKSPPSPITDECSSGSSSASSDHQGEACGPPTTETIHPVPTITDRLTTPIMKTFKGFRKQLDLLTIQTVGEGRTKESPSPMSSPPVSPSARSGLRPPSPLRRFSSFSQGLPTPGSASSPNSPTNKSLGASRRQSSNPPLSPKPAPVRRVSSVRAESSENTIPPVENTSPLTSSRFNTFHGSPSYSMREDSETGIPWTPLILDSVAAGSPMVDDNNNTDNIGSHQQITPTMDDKIEEDQPKPAGTSAPPSSSRTDSFHVGRMAIINVAESSGEVPPNDTLHASPERRNVVMESIQSDNVVAPAAPVAKASLMSTLLDRTNSFRVPPIDTSTLAADSDGCETKDEQPLTLRDSPTDCLAPFRHSTGSPTDNGDASPSCGRTTSFRMRARSGSFKIPSSQSSPENSPSRRVNTLVELSLDSVDVFDDVGSDIKDNTASSPRNGNSEASAASPSKSLLRPRSPRSRQEQTEVVSLSPTKSENAGERPLFFRRTNIGQSPLERRSSYSSFSTASASPPRSPTAAGLHNTSNASSSRVTELENEISAMRSSHESIVAALRATNKQHAATVLELRAQVAALTEGNLWLERQLTAKGELVRELREMEQRQQRDNVSVSEVEKILEIKDAQIQTLEREMGQLRQRLARLESDKDSQLYRQYQHYEARRARDEKRINDLRKEVLSMCNERCELQSEMRDLKEMTLRFF